jgi:hypothetical protein
MQKGLTYEEAHAAKPVGYIFESVALENTNPPEMKKFIMLGSRQNPGDVQVYTEDVVLALKGEIESLKEQLSGHRHAYENMRAQYESERQRQFTEPGWFFPKSWISDTAGHSLNHLIDRAKQASITNITVAPGQPYEVKYEGDWIKYGFEVTPSAMPVAEDKVATLFDAIKHGDDAHQAWLKDAIEAHFAGRDVPEVVMKSSDEQAWVVKLGAAIARYQNPQVISGMSGEKRDELYQRLMKQVGMPDSHSLLSAFQQLTNELTYGGASLLDIVQLVCGNKKESEVFWGNTVQEAKESPLYLVSTDKLITDAKGGTHPAKVTINSPVDLADWLKRAGVECTFELPASEKKVLGKQAGVVHYVGGRIRLYDMGDTYAAELKVFPVYFEEGVMPPELNPLHVTKEQVALPSNLGDVLHKWASGSGVYENARREMDCTSCPMQPVLEGCCKGMRSSTGPQAEYEQALARYNDMLDSALDAYVSESMFKSSPEFMDQIRTQMREHYLNEWKKTNTPLMLAKQAAAPGSHQTGVQDNSVKKKVAFFTEAQLRDPTLLQKAVVMGMAGTPAQQDEARVFLTQYLAINTNLHSAADAFLKL